MAAKGGLTVSVNFTPQAVADLLSVGEDATESLGLTAQMKANDGGGAGATIIGITLDSVSAVKANLTNYVNLANFASPISTDVNLGFGQLHLDNLGNVTLTSSANGDYDHIALGQHEDLSFTYILRMGNGAFSVTTATIRVEGANDAPVATAVTSGVYEDASIAGALQATDPDDGAVLTYTAGAAPGLVVNADGSYSFDASGLDYQHLAAGVTADVAVEYTVTDEHGASSTSGLTIQVTGTNDAASITGLSTGSVTEDTTLSASGQLTVSDVDDGEAQFLSIGTFAGVYGSFTIDGDGNWTYDVDNAAIQGLNTGDIRLDTFTVSSLDGTALQDVTITINGLNEPVVTPPPPTSATWTVDPNDQNGGHVPLPEGATNVTLVVTANGDFDWEKEGFDITGDIVASYRGPNEKNSVGNQGPETSDFITFNVPVTLTGIADHSVDYTLTFTNEVNPHSSLTFSLHWDL